MVTRDVSYFVFDIESVADGALLSRLRYPSDSLSPEMAITKYREELIEETGKDFIPYTFQLPVSLVVAKIAADYKLTDLVALDEEQSRPHEITRLFWDGWRKYGKPCLVSFHGRGFDLPLLELAAFRYGLEIPDWFAESKRSFEQPRNRYNIASHFDLHEWLTNFGALGFMVACRSLQTLLGSQEKWTSPATWFRICGTREKRPRFMTTVAQMCSIRILSFCVRALWPEKLRFTRNTRSSNMRENGLKHEQKIRPGSIVI